MTNSIFPSFLSRSCTILCCLSLILLVRNYRPGASGIVSRRDSSLRSRRRTDVPYQPPFGRRVRTMFRSLTSVRRRGRRISRTCLGGTESPDPDRTSLDLCPPKTRFGRGRDFRCRHGDAARSRGGCWGPTPFSSQLGRFLSDDWRTRLTRLSRTCVVCPRRPLGTHEHLTSELV